MTRNSMLDWLERRFIPDRFDWWWELAAASWSLSSAVGYFIHDDRVGASYCAALAAVWLLAWVRSRRILTLCKLNAKILLSTDRFRWIGYIRLDVSKTPQLDIRASMNPPFPSSGIYALCIDKEVSK
jgi:hypothetical protein